MTDFSNNYGILPPKIAAKRDPYGQISVRDMTVTKAKAQYEGVACNYPVPDTDALFHRIHG